MAASKFPKFTHLVGGTYLVPLEDIYGSDGDSNSISAICGIVKLGQDPVPANAKTATARALVKSGELRRLKLRLSNKKIRVAYIISANATQYGAMKGKAYDGVNTIATAYFPETFTFSF